MTQNWFQGKTLNPIFTIGYERANIEDFVATLRYARIDVVIDIRAVAVSRKRGFSKRSLADILADAEIDYVYLRDLGDPKPGREAARRGDMADFRRIFFAGYSKSISRVKMLKKLLAVP